jgi:tetratricopeptide (TPR) repeat protein
MNEETLFHLALQKAAGERAAFLAEACGDDDTLRRRLEVLLGAHDHPGSFLQGPAVHGPDAADTQPGLLTDEGGPIRSDVGAPHPRRTGEGAGSQVGPYRLLRPIGEGGMGTVFLAEQTQPVQRQVALKIIKPGMDSRQVIARFEAERQALALMDHPNIAKVLDAGTTDSGRPFFVMELVQGAPLTTYCDEARLPVRERLELFVPVCQAVQHAHQKGIIHRDLKPSNVLIALYDGKPVPKVIDFGVAKATGPKLTERTLFTEVGSVVGTLEYMSPEQAELNPLDIDTRSDVYALGVMLYELLTGTTPLDWARLEGEGLLEALRVIREEEPPRPSARLSTISELPLIASRRGLEPAKLSGLLRGELDWIVMKCLEKDRNRRYETANGLARDLERYLHDEPVQACPPSAGYRLRKFARRHRRALLALTLLGVVSLTGVGSIVWAVSDRAARLESLDGQVAQAIGDARSLLAEGLLYEAQDAAKRAEGLLATREGNEVLHDQVEQLGKDLKMVERLQEIRLERAAVSATSFDESAADASCVDAFRGYGIDVESLGRDEVIERIAKSGIRIELAVALDDWAVVRRAFPMPSGPDWAELFAISRLADPDPLRNRLREALVRNEARGLSELADAPEVLDLPPMSLVQMAVELCAKGRAKQAAGLLQQARRKFPRDFWINEQLGLCHRLMKPPREDEAVRFFTVAVAVRPQSPGAHQNLGVALSAKGATDEAIAELREAVRLAPHFARAHTNLGADLCEKGELDEAIACHQEAIKLQPAFAEAHNNLGQALYIKGRVDDAVACYREAIRLKPTLADAHRNYGLALMSQKKLDDAITSFRQAVKLRPDYVAAHGNLGNALLDKGQLDDAIACYEKASQLDPNNARYHYYLGNALVRGKRVDDAIASFRRSIQLDPGYALAHNNLGNALQEKGLLDDAVGCYEQALHLDPNYAFAHFNLGNALRKQKQLERAVACYLQAIKIDPNYAKAYVNLGVAYKDQGRLDDAVTAYGQAIKLQPESVTANNGLGYTYLAKGRPEEAVTCFRKVIKIDPSNAGAYNGLGVALTRQGQWREGIAAFEKASRLGPGEPVIHTNLAWWLTSCPDQQLRDPRRAGEAAAKAVKLAPQSAMAWQVSGWAHYRARAWKDSIAALEKSVALEGEASAWQGFFLAMAHWRLGNKLDAREWYDRALRWMAEHAPQDDHLRRFCDEAGQLMGLKETGPASGGPPQSAARKIRIQA